MMDIAKNNFLEIQPFLEPIKGTIEIPGSKSYTNRALIMAVLTKGIVTLEHPLYCEDTQAMIQCLRQLGVHIETLPHQLIVYSDLSSILPRNYDLFTHNSGTTTRFLLPLLCIIPGIKKIQGHSRLNERPIHDLVSALRQLGASIEYVQEEGKLPLIIHSKTLTKTFATLDASKSSQFLSALLMIAPLLEGLTLQLVDHLISKPYADMTIEMMKQWGISLIQNSLDRYTVSAGQSYHHQNYKIEGDYSSAGYFLAIAALTQSTLTLQPLNPYSRQADRKFVTFLQDMGNKIHLHDQSITIEGKGIRPVVIDMESCPDQVQTMAVLAAFAKGTTKISGIRSLRLKETERIVALKKELGKMGIQIEDSDNTLTIHGGDPKPANISTYGDHRMAMAFAVAGTKLSGINIQHPEVVDKTFPQFWDKLRSL